MIRTYYHGSEDAALRIVPGGRRPGTFFPFTALFLADSYDKAAVYGPHVYAIDVDVSKLFHRPPQKPARELFPYFRAFDDEYRKQGRPVDPEEASGFTADLALWDEALDEDDVPFLAFVFNCSPWLARKRLERFRLFLTRRLGNYIGATFNDGCGTIAVLEEFMPAEPRHATKEE